MTTRLLILAVALIALIGCERKGDDQSDNTTPPAATAAGNKDAQAPAAPEVPAIADADVYVIRGLIKMLPDPAKPASSLMIRHQAIDNFVGRDGKVIGMNSMVMPFTVAEGLSLDGLAVGDIVEFTWEVAPGHTPAAVTKIVKLPPDTQLEFRKANPPTGG
jgi:Cu/Ag efflux protein CusF